MIFTLANFVDVHGDRMGCSAWSALRSEFHVRKRSNCPPNLLIQAFRSEVCNHVSKGLHCEFSTVSPIHFESLGTWTTMLFDPFRFDRQIKRIGKILFRCLRFIWHWRW